MQLTALSRKFDIMAGSIFVTGGVGFIGKCREVARGDRGVAARFCLLEAPTSPQDVLFWVIARSSATVARHCQPPPPPTCRRPLSPAGSHTVLVLLEHGFKVVLMDNLDNSFQKAYDRMVELAGDKAGQMKFVEVRLAGGTPTKGAKGASTKGYHSGTILSCALCELAWAAGRCCKPPFAC